MTNILNPYIAGAPVVETSMFFGREDIFGWIERSLTGKFVNHILVLHGQRRVGKTSVLKQIPRHLPKHYVQVFFDLQGRTNTTLDRFLWWMASEITRTLKKECNLDLQKIDRNAFADPEAFINDFLPSLHTLIGDKVLLLTFDEFDTLDQPDIQDSLARPLIAYLRRLMEIEGLNFIFSIGSSGNKLENMQASYTDFFKSALYRKVSFLTRDDCVRLITKPVEGTITYEPAAVDNISHFTSGHPYFTQLMCHELFSRCQKTGRRVITSHDVDRILEDVIERGTVNLKFVWDEASDLEKWILATLAQVEGASLKHVHQILKEQGLRSSEAELNSAILHLRDKDVLTDNNCFVIQLMKLWLQTNRPMDRVREELVQTNPISDRYIEIGDEYRERGENQQAIQSYQQALQVQANNVRALSNIAAIQMSQNENASAAETFRKILAIDDENIAARQGFSQANMAIAAASLNEGREDEAERAYKAILHFNPTNPEANKQLAVLYVRQAEGYFKNDQEEQAFEKFNQAIALTPEDVSIKQRYEKIIAEKRAKQVQEWLDKADKSLARQRWDEAASMIEEAINIDPDNPVLRNKLLDIKDAPRQEKIKSYKKEAEQAIGKGNYPKAISAIQTAILLAPEDGSLKEWLDSIQSDQSNAQLRLLQSQADQAETANNWDAAITAREAALKLDPQNERLLKALQNTRDAKRRQQLKSLRAQIDRAKQDRNWDAALVAGEEYLKESPEDNDFKNELETLKVEQRKTRLVSLKNQAISASKAEKWEDAIQYWQVYLTEQPQEAEKIKSLIEQAKQKAALLKDYETAQAHIRKRQYNRAIHLLQGIIAKDPTYKSSSRLLVEAVEANKQKKPFWKTPWIYVGAGVLVLAVVVLIMLPQIRNWMEPIIEPAAMAEENATEIVSASPTPAGKIITVTNAEFSGDGSLRSAILNAKSWDTITFDPQVFPPYQPTTIFLTTELPRIKQSHITLDASNAGVILEGSNLSDNNFGLILNSDYNKILGLQIINCPGVAIYIEGGSYNQIGGDRNIGIGPIGQGNLIINNGIGISLLSFSGGNVITGNIIGTDFTLTEPMGNGMAGIIMEDTDSYASIPNTFGPDNVIAYNGNLNSVDTPTAGIMNFSGKNKIVVTGNSIFNNFGKGISYPGYDHEVDPPVIIYHDLESGVLSGHACPGCEVEIFSTYQNEGDTFEGAVKADDFGNFVFYKGKALSGPNLTAVAISSNDKTSEFSNPPSSSSAMRAAMNLIKTEPPDYQSSFDVWEFGDPGENVSIENGNLILPTEWKNIGQVLSEQSSDKLAVQFELQIAESESEGACFMGMSNNDINRSSGVALRADGFSFTEQYFHPNGVQHIAEGSYDYLSNQPNEVLIIVVEDQHSVFVNNQLIYSFLDPQGSVVFNQQSVSAEWGVTCEFENYKVWNLEGLEFEAPLPPEAFTEGRFDEPILRYINDNSPTFEDDFSSPNPAWGNILFSNYENPLINYVSDNQLNIPGGVVNASFPLNDLFDATNFALSFNIEVGGSSGGPGSTSGVGIKFRSDSNRNSFYSFEISPTAKSWRIIQSTGGYNQLQSGILGSSVNEVSLIVFDDRAVIFLDGQLSASIDDIDSANSTNFISIKTWQNGTSIEPFNFDNFQFWNLDGVEIEFDAFEHQGTQTYNNPSWVTDFVNPVLDYVENRPPDYDDNFEISSNIWKLPGISEFQKSVVDGEMIVNGTVENTMITYHDYMIDVNIRHVTAGRGGIEFDNGSLVRCDIWVSNEGESVHFSCSDPSDFEITPGNAEITTLRLIVKGSRIAIIVNQQPVAYIEDENFRLYRGEKPSVSLSTYDGGVTTAFSNFRAWNLTQLEIP